MISSATAPAGPPRTKSAAPLMSKRSAWGCNGPIVSSCIPTVVGFQWDKTFNSIYVLAISAEAH